MIQIIGETAISIAVVFSLLISLIYFNRQTQSHFNKINAQTIQRPQGISYRTIRNEQKIILNDQKIYMNELKIESLEPSIPTFNLEKLSEKDLI